MDIEQGHQNMVDIWEHFRTDLAFLIDLVPILPDSLFWRAVGLATHMNTDFNPLRFWGTPLGDRLDPRYMALMDPPLYALLLETLAARLPHHGRLAFLDEALTRHPKLACYLPSHLLQEALVTVRTMKRAELRPPLLAALATSFPYPQQDALLDEALAAVSTLWSIQREMALRQMTAFLPKPIKKDLLQRILEIANSFKLEPDRARIFTVLAPIVPTSVKNEVRQEAMNAAMAVREDSPYKGEVMEKLFAILPPSGKRGLVFGALANARATKDEWGRVRAVRNLLPLLSKPLKGDALTLVLTVVRETEDLSTCAELIEMLIPFLPKYSKKALLKDGLTIIRAIDEDRRKEVVTSLAPHFAGMVTRKELLDVVASVREIKNEEDRAEAFVALISLVPEPLKGNLLQEILATLYSLENGFKRSWVVGDLIRVTPMPLQGQILQEVLTITEQIRDVSWQAAYTQMMATQEGMKLVETAYESQQAPLIRLMAPYLAQDVALLWRAFTMALKMKSERHLTKALGSLYHHFPKELLPEALARTVAVEDEVIRAWALVEISPYLIDDQLLREALEAALAIQGQYARALALAGLSFALEERKQASPELMRQVLTGLPEEQRYAVLEDMLLSFWIRYQFFIITGAAESSPTQEPIPVPGWSQRFQPLPPLRLVQEPANYVNFTFHNVTQEWNPRELELHEGFLSKNRYQLIVGIGPEPDKRFGGPGTPPEIERPETAEETIDLHVALFSRDDALVSIVEPLTILKWPAIGPSSENAEFILEVASTDTQHSTILDVYMYHKANLLYTASFKVIVQPPDHEWELAGRPITWSYKPDLDKNRSQLFQNFAHIQCIAERGLSLAIQSGGRPGEYLLTAFVGRAEFPARVNLTREELNYYLVEMRKLMDDLRKKGAYIEGGYTREGMYIGDYAGRQGSYNRLRESMERLAVLESFNSFMKQMAHHGSQFYDALFRSDSAQLLRDIIEVKLQEGDIIQIWIDKDAGDFVYPWTWLYTKMVDPSRFYKVENDQFWGYKYIIEQLPQFRETIGRVPPPNEMPATQLNIKVGVWNFEPTTAMQKEYFARRREKSAGHLQYEIWDETNPWQMFLPKCDSQILYFFSHGHTAKPTTLEGKQFYDMLARWKEWLAHPLEGEDSWMRQYRQRALGDLKDFEKNVGLRSETYIRLQGGYLLLRELRRIMNLKRSAPLVFLNICESAQVFPSISESLIDVFLKKGARGVIGTEIPMIDAFAELFARQFFDALFSQQDKARKSVSVGQILFDLRRKFLDMGNPLGFAYTFFGDATTRLSQPITIQDPPI